MTRRHQVAFDPGIGKQYARGRNLLGKGVVCDGNYFEVLDPSKLSKFIAWAASFQDS